MISQDLAYTEDQLSSFEDTEILQICKFYKFDFTNKKDSINYLISLYGTGKKTYNPEINNPYQYLNIKELQLISTDRKLKFPFNSDTKKLTEILIDDDIKTNHTYKKNIFKKNMFELNNNAELIFLGGVYKTSLSEFNSIDAKNLLYILMIIPKLNNFLNPIDMSSNEYLQKIKNSTKLKALNMYDPIGIDCNLLTEEEIELTFKNCCIPNKYNLYTERKQRFINLNSLNIFIKQHYLYYLDKECNIYNIVKTTNDNKFEKLLNINFDNENEFELLINKIGMIIPIEYDINFKSQKEYFLDNYLEYAEVVQNEEKINTFYFNTNEKAKLYDHITEGTLLEYLKMCKDRKLFDDIGFVYYKSRKDLISKLYKLTTDTQTFFINFEENKEFPLKFLNISFGNFSNYTTYTNIQLFTSFNKNDDFLKPDKEQKFDSFQINELLPILLCYANICQDLIKIIIKKLKIKNLNY